MTSFSVSPCDDLNKSNNYANIAFLVSSLDGELRKVSLENESIPSLKECEMRLEVHCYNHQNNTFRSLEEELKVLRWLLTFLACPPY